MICQQVFNISRKPANLEKCLAAEESGSMEEIRYVKQKEKHGTRGLYEIAFSEDSEEFVDYYYEWKTSDNQILVMEEDRKIQVMMHLNPYTIWFYGRLQTIPYIVAVATEPGCRRQGKMGRVMEYALQDLADRKVPFAFLLPADPAYYQGQGFVFFSQVFSVENHRETGDLQAAEAPQLPNETLQEAVHSEFGIRQTPEAAFCFSEEESHAEEKGMQWRQANKEDIPEIIEFSNNILKEQYHIFIKRDEGYYKRLFAEVKTERGGILIWKNREVTQGVLVYGMEEPARAEVKELLLTPGICSRTREALTEVCRGALPDCEIAFGEFDMMFRIASLREFVFLMKSETKRCYDVKVKDSAVTSNCGCYRIEIGKSGGRIQEISGESVKQEMDISELAGMLVRDTRVNLREWV